MVTMAMVDEARERVRIALEMRRAGSRFAPGDTDGRYDIDVYIREHRAEVERLLGECHAARSRRRGRSSSSRSGREASSVPAPSIPVSVVLAAIDGRKPEEAVRILVLLAEASIAPARPLPLWQDGLRWIGVEWQTFRCERLRSTMPIWDCLVRRSRVWPSGGGKGCPRYRECQGCPVGEENAAKCPGIVLPPSTMPRETLPPSQARAKRARALVGLDDGEVERLDPLRVASWMTPDDPNDWRR